jgi:cytochrome c oxidase subunit 3
MGKPTHEYHLVDPSPYPFLASMALLSTAVGAVMYMHDKPMGGALLTASLLCVVAVAIVWWRKVIQEGRVDKAHTGLVQKGLQLGMILFIVSELMFFFGFFFSFFKSSLFPVNILEVDGVWPAMQGVWPPEGIETFNAWGLPFINTIILLVSSFTVSIAHHAVVKGDQKKVARWLLITVILGATFTALQAYEYHHAAFGFTDGVYASNFYLATGFHGFHVLVGTIFLFVCLIRANRGTLTVKGHLGLEFAAWYWHFVDVVWIFLFTWVYVWAA